MKNGASNMKPNQSKRSRTTHHAPRFTLHTSYLVLFLFLFSLYLLTYTPRLNSSDGLAMFSTAESLVRRGALDVEQIRWMDLQQGTFGLDRLLYSRKGIGVPIGLLPLTWLGLVVPWWGTVGTSLLFNAIVTALTAVLLRNVQRVESRGHEGVVDVVRELAGLVDLRGAGSDLVLGEPADDLA